MTIDPGRLDAAKLRAGIRSDAELARRVGVGAAAVNKWRDGSRVPGGPELLALADALAVPPRWLLGAEALSDVEVVIAFLSPEQRGRVLAYARGILDAEGPRVPSVEEAREGRYSDGRPVAPATVPAAAVPGAAPPPKRPRRR